MSNSSSMEINGKCCIEGKKQTGFNFHNVPSYNSSLLLSVEFQSQGGDGKGDIQHQKTHKMPGVLYL